MTGDARDYFHPENDARKHAESCAKIRAAFAEAENRETLRSAVEISENTRHLWERVARILVAPASEAHHG